MPTEEIDDTDDVLEIRLGGAEEVPPMPLPLGHEDDGPIAGDGQSVNAQESNRPDSYPIENRSPLVDHYPGAVIKHGPWNSQYPTAGAAFYGINAATAEPGGDHIVFEKFVEQLDDSNHGELQKDSGPFSLPLSLAGMFFAEIGAESPDTEYAWQKVTLDATGAWEVADPAYSSTTESINAIEINTRSDVPLGTIVRMFKIRESDGDVAFRFVHSAAKVFFAEIGAESPTTEYAWIHKTLDASGAWETASPAFSSTTEGINAIEVNARVLIPSGTIVQMYEIRESDGDTAYRFALLPIGTFASPLALAVGADVDAPAGDSWTRVGQTVGGDDGFTFPIHRVSYAHAGDQVLHGQYRIVTVDHWGMVSVGSVETEYTIDTPVDCPSDVDGGAFGSRNASIQAYRGSGEPASLLAGEPGLDTDDGVLYMGTSKAVIGAFLVGPVDWTGITGNIDIATNNLTTGGNFVIDTRTGKLLLGDSAIGVYSQADTFMDLYADGAVRIGDSSAGAPSHYLNVDTSADSGDTWWVGSGSGLPYGHMYVDGTQVIRVALTMNTPAEIEGDGTGGTAAAEDGWLGGDLNLVTFPTGGTEHYIAVTKAGVYHVNWNISFTMVTGAANTQIHAGLAVDGVAIRDKCEAHRTISNNSDTGNMAGSCMVDLPNGNEELSLWMENTTNNNDANVNHGSLVAVMVGGT